ncbi:MAG: FAD-dependent oxidoreductase [Candidatus Limnocylindria bacterium]
MAVVRTIRCTVLNVVDHGERVYSVTLEPSAPIPRFLPGQFLHLALDPYEPGSFWPESRVFSIASSPDEHDRLHITFAVKGAYTTRMERELSPGSTVWVKLPYGEFVVDRTRDAVLFAGGTGVTAFTAFLQSLPREHPRRVDLFYGARTDDLFVHGDLVEACARNVPSLRCSLVCEAIRGRLDVGIAWPSIQTLREPLFYLSGPPLMIAALGQQLRAHGVSAKYIRIDAWD